MRTLVAVLLLGLAACSGESSDPQASGTPDPELLAPTATTPAATEAPDPTATGAESPAKVSQIPATLRGRWGLVPRDCTDNMGAEKGLVTIGATEMKFYESVAKLTSVTASTPTSISGTFAYDGEGMQWTRKVNFASTDGGKTLTFEEFGDDAPAGPRIYTKCQG